LLPGQIEEVLLEHLRRRAEAAQSIGQASLAQDRALQRRDDRDAEIAEQAREVEQVGLDPRPRGPSAELCQEEVLHVDHDAPAPIRDDAPAHRVIAVAQGDAARQRGISADNVVRTKPATSAYALSTGESTRWTRFFVMRTSCSARWSMPVDRKQLIASSGVSTIGSPLT